MSLVTCPYCNSQTAPPSALVHGQRLVCGRCGESFVFRGSEETPVPVSPAPAVAVAPPPVVLGRRWSNRAVAIVVLGGMGLAACAALAFALATIDFRRSNDTQGQEPSATEVKIVAPKHLPALGYVPKEATVVA